MKYEHTLNPLISEIGLRNRVFNAVATKFSAQLCIKSGASELYSTLHNRVITSYFKTIDNYALDAASRMFTVRI